MYVELRACVPSALGYRPIYLRPHFRLVSFLKRRAPVWSERRRVCCITQNGFWPGSFSKTRPSSNQKLQLGQCDRFSCPAVNHLAVFTFPSDLPAEVACKKKKKKCGSAGNRVACCNMYTHADDDVRAMTAGEETLTTCTEASLSQHCRRGEGSGCTALASLAVGHHE